MTDQARPTVRAVVFTPTPLATITIEAGSRGDEVHLHAGGQGVWQARMLSRLGVDVVLCGLFAGEVGTVVRALVTDDRVRVVGGAAQGTNGAYVHDRRHGERRRVADMAATPPSRHELDDVYGRVLVEAVDSDVCLLAGPDATDVVAPGLYRRLADDLASSGARVVVDLHGAYLDEVLSGAPVSVKISEDELVEDGRATARDEEAVAAAMSDLVEQGAGTVIVTRGDRPTLAWGEEGLGRVRAPTFEATEPRGAGDSFVAAYAATVAGGGTHRRALQVGAAAGALNVTRHGLASGQRDTILRLADEVRVEPVPPPTRRQ